MSCHSPLHPRETPKGLLTLPHLPPPSKPAPLALASTLPDTALAKATSVPLGTSSNGLLGKRWGAGPRPPSGTLSPCGPRHHMFLVFLSPATPLHSLVWSLFLPPLPSQAPFLVLHTLSDWDCVHTLTHEPLSGSKPSLQLPLFRLLFLQSPQSRQRDSCLFRCSDPKPRHNPEFPSPARSRD